MPIYSWAIISSREEKKISTRFLPQTNIIEFISNRKIRRKNTENICHDIHNFCRFGSFFKWIFIAVFINSLTFEKTIVYPLLTHRQNHNIRTIWCLTDKINRIETDRVTIGNNQRKKKAYRNIGKIMVSTNSSICKEFFVFFVVGSFISKCYCCLFCVCMVMSKST